MNDAERAMRKVTFLSLLLNSLTRSASAMSGNMRRSLAYATATSVTGVQ